MVSPHPPRGYKTRCLGFAIFDNCSGMVLTVCRRPKSMNILVFDQFTGVNDATSIWQIYIISPFPGTQMRSSREGLVLIGCLLRQVTHNNCKSIRARAQRKHYKSFKCFPASHLNIAKSEYHNLKNRPWNTGKVKVKTKDKFYPQADLLTLFSIPCNTACDIISEPPRKYWTI